MTEVANIAGATVRRSAAIPPIDTGGISVLAAQPSLRRHLVGPCSRGHFLDAAGRAATRRSCSGTAPPRTSASTTLTPTDPGLRRRPLLRRDRHPRPGVGRARDRRRGAGQLPDRDVDARPRQRPAPASTCAPTPIKSPAVAAVLPFTASPAATRSGRGAPPVRYSGRPHRRQDHLRRPVPRPGRSRATRRRRRHRQHHGHLRARTTRRDRPASRPRRPRRAHRRPVPPRIEPRWRSSAVSSASASAASRRAVAAHAGHNPISIPLDAPLLGAAGALLVGTSPASIQPPAPLAWLPPRHCERSDQRALFLGVRR